MINGKKVSVILPAYNCEETIKRVVSEIPRDLVDTIILVDDFSVDNTVLLAESLSIDIVLKHSRNKGYGANQKTCYNKAIEIDSDIIIMLHPDYQYTPKLIHSMAYIISNNLYQVVFGSRILGNGALKGGMPLYKYISNRILTLFQNIVIGQKLSEYHTGYRAFSKEVLNSISYEKNSDNFIFDNQIILQIFHLGYEICEITCPTNYSNDSSSISIKNSIIYGVGVIWNSFKYLLHIMKIYNFKILK